MAKKKTKTTKKAPAKKAAESKNYRDMLAKNYKSVDDAKAALPASIRDRVTSQKKVAQKTPRGDSADVFRFFYK